jgi:acyl-CoA dehydrogenase
MTHSVLLDTAERLFADQMSRAVLDQADQGLWPAHLWQAVEDAGFPLALIPQDIGGFDLDPAEAVGIIRRAGAHAVPLPLAETMLAHWVAALLGLSVPQGPLTLAPTATSACHLRQSGSGWRLSGSANRVPWARHAAAVVLVAWTEDQTPYAVVMPPQAATLTPGQNLAGEPRDDLTLDLDLSDDQLAPLGFDPAILWAAGAALRCQAMAGALEAVLDLTVTYANERIQFGRPIGKFQAVQHTLAILAGQVAAADGAAGLAAEALRAPLAGLPITPISAAKIRLGEGAGIAAAIAHQVLGAMGFTHEHTLHFFTRRLWSWRDEYGSETWWSEHLGSQILDADDPWDFITKVA